MKKLILTFVFIFFGIFLFSADNRKPERPVSVPEGAERFGSKDEPYWLYTIMNNHDLPFITWYTNGNPRLFRYEIENKKFSIVEHYYDNGKLKDINQYIRYSYLYDIFKNNSFASDNVAYVGKQQLFYENGMLKEERSYTPVVQKDKKIRSVLCGPEIFYDETGKETKRIEHKVKCEYGYDVIPRKSVNELVAMVKPYKDKLRNDNLVRLPVVGKIASLDLSLKEIKISYNPGFALNVGDQICFIIDSEIVSFECRSNDSVTGIYTLKDDSKGKLPLLKTSSEPRFYKKNDVKYTDVLKSGGKPKAGDVKIIAGIEFVYIPEGDFFEKYRNDNSKIDKRHVNAFWMTKYEVTLGEYLKLCYEQNLDLPDNKTALKLDSRYPASLGKYYDRADRFCGWFGHKHGVETVLPEPYEWEYAARGGTTTDFYWGDKNTGDYCWYEKNSGGKLHPVGQKKPNAYGLYDIIGNAWEWCRPFFLRGGSCKSDINDLYYDVNLMIDYVYEDDRGGGYQEITDQGTGFRMIIRVTE